jgi:hypothetical protein
MAFLKVRADYRVRVAGVILDDSEPSTVRPSQIHCWTQFFIGTQSGAGRRGAVKPPDPDHGWFPATIGRDSVVIATTKSFACPKEAIDWLLARERRASRRRKARGSR